MSLFVRRAFAIAAVVLCTAACKDTLELDDQQFGFVDIITATGPSAGLYRTQPTGTFFQAFNATGILNTTVTPDSCRVEVYTATVNPGSPPAFLDAGPQVTLAFPATNIVLTPAPTSLVANYQPAGPSVFNPGDSVTVTVPGATPGFPAFTLKTKTAESFTFTAPTVPATGQDLQLTWTPAASAPGSAMIFSLRYAGNGSSTLNEQVFCVLQDDGSHIVPDNQLRLWRLATNGLRESVAIRFRSTIVRNGAALLQVRSRFDVPTPATP
jgi:hypothetical protein